MGKCNWSGTYELLNNTMECMLHPEESQNLLHIEVETTDGSISIEIKDADGAVLFNKENMDTSSYDVDISGDVTAKIVTDAHRGSFNLSSHSGNLPELKVQNVGKIYLFGEEHDEQKIMEKELELWENYYFERGMRDLFIEYPCYTAEFFNLWMKAEDDAILDEVFGEFKGTATDSQDVKNFYKNIKLKCPDTVFHGTVCTCRGSDRTRQVLLRT